VPVASLSQEKRGWGVFTESKIKLVSWRGPVSKSRIKNVINANENLFISLK
jgi:hypothetical protein